MPKYRTTALPRLYGVGEIMSFFTTCFDSTAIPRERREEYPFWALIYTRRGRLTFHIGDQYIPVRAGELIFYPPDVPHSIASFEEKNWEVSFATFRMEGDGLAPLVGRGIVPGDRTCERIDSLFHFGGKLFYNLPPKDDTVGMYCRGDERQLSFLRAELESVLSEIALTSGAPEGMKKSDPVFLSATEYMKAHIGEPITLPLLANEVGVSVSTLKKSFAKESGGGVNRYYINMKLSAGAKMLRESDMTVGEIAERLGFATQFYFSEQFKARYGLPPTVYRRQQESAWSGLI